MIGGGVPHLSTVLVAGESGTGKTTLCMQFLCKGAEMNERGLYFSAFSEPPELMLRFISTYEFVNPQYFKGCIKYVDLGGFCEDRERLLQAIEAEVNSFRPQRMVIDSLSVLERALKQEYRPLLLWLARMIRQWPTTTLVAGEPDLGESYPAEIAALVDGVIILYNAEMGCMRRRSMEILKMVGTSHRCGKQAVDISAKGFIVYPGL